MAQAIVNPEELRRFAQVLRRFNGDLRDALSALHAQLVGLGETWRDQEHDRFRLDFEQTMQVVERFLIAIQFSQDMAASATESRLGWDLFDRGIGEFKSAWQIGRRRKCQ